MGRLRSGASWGSIERPGPSRWGRTWECWVLQSTERSLMDPPIIHRHPNMAVILLSAKPPRELLVVESSTPKKLLPLVASSLSSCLQAGYAATFRSEEH